MTMAIEQPKTKLDEGVLDVICEDFHDLHTHMLDQVEELSVSELIARTIMGTAVAIEKRYLLTSLEVCEPNGDPHHSSGIGLYYWNDVSEMHRSGTLGGQAETHTRNPESNE